MTKQLQYKALEQPLLPPAAAPIGFDLSPPAVLSRARRAPPAEAAFPFAPPAIPVAAWGWTAPELRVDRRPRLPPVEAAFPFAPAAGVAWGWEAPPAELRTRRRVAGELAPALPALTAPAIPAPLWGWDAAPTEVRIRRRLAALESPFVFLPPPVGPLTTPELRWLCAARPTTWSLAARATSWLLEDRPTQWREVDR